MPNSMMEYINEKMDEIKEICDEFNYKTNVLDIEKYKIPTMAITIDQDAVGDDIVLTCNLLPLVIEEYSTLFIQFYMCISDVIPKDRIDIINEFIQKQNEKFMIGNILNFEDAVCIKYSLYLSANEKIDRDLFARSLDIFVYQANIMLMKVQDLARGKISIEEALEEGTFFYERARKEQ